MKAHNENKKRYDKKRNNSITFEVGDYVYVENKNKLNRHKLDQIRIGPFPITQKLSNTVFELNVGYKSNSKRFYHVSKMIKMTKDSESKQSQPA